MKELAVSKKTFISLETHLLPRRILGNDRQKLGQQTIWERAAVHPILATPMGNTRWKKHHSTRASPSHSILQYITQKALQSAAMLYAPRKSRDWALQLWSP